MNIWSALDGIARALPALTRARKLQKRAASVGFDWPERNGVLAKIEEEFTEVSQALSEQEGAARIEEELGDLLFATVNLARWEGIDPERALRFANEKFERRFKALEAQLTDDDRRPQDCDLAALDTLWENVKREEHKR